MAFIYVRVPITSFLSSSYTPELYQLFRLESIASEAITIFLILLATSGIFKQAIYFQFYLHYFMSEEEKRAILVMSWWKLWLLVKENDTTYLVNCATIKRLISASIWRSRDMRDTEARNIETSTWRRQKASQWRNFASTYGLETLNADMTLLSA